jgi:hypothetical protein
VKDSLQHRETTEKEDPEQPTSDCAISNDQSCHRQAAALQLRPCSDLGERKVSANYPGNSRDHDRRAAKSTYPEQAQNKRPDGKRLSLTSRYHNTAVTGPPTVGAVTAGTLGVVAPVGWGDALPGGPLLLTPGTVESGAQLAAPSYHT